MPEATQTLLFKVTIDNITVEVPAGTSFLKAERKISRNVAPVALCFCIRNPQKFLAHNYGLAHYANAKEVLT